MKKIVILTVAVLALGGGAAWHFLRTAKVEEKQAEEKTKKIATVKAAKGDLKVVVESTGKVKPEQEVEIKCKASGEVIELPVDVSDPVKKDIVLLKLDPVDEKNTLKTAQVTLTKAQSQVEQAKLALEVARLDLKTERRRAQADLASAEASAAEAAAKLERTTLLRKQQMSSQEELENATSAAAQAKSALEDAKARIDELKAKELKIEQGEHDIKIAEATVVSNRIAIENAEQRLKDTTVLSPIDGVVSSRSVQIGQIISSGTSNVSGGTTVMVLADLSRMYVLVSVDESSIGNIKVGQRASITVEAYPDINFPGEVVRVATTGVSTSNVVTFEVKVEVKGPQFNLLKPGMTATANITAVDKKDILLLASGAVQRQGREHFVNIKTAGGESEKRAVTVGDSDGDKTEIISGLEEGDSVVLPEGGGASRWKREDNSREAQERVSREARIKSGPLGTGSGAGAGAGRSTAPSTGRSGGRR